MTVAGASPEGSGDMNDAKVLYNSVFGRGKRYPVAGAESEWKAVSIAPNVSDNADRGRDSPAKQREIERALSADIDTGMRRSSGQNSPGDSMVKAIAVAEKAIDELGGPLDKVLNAKHVETLRLGRSVRTPSAKLLMAAEPLGVVMKQPCRLGEPLELLRQVWSPLEQLSAVVSRNDGQGGVDVMCREVNALMDQLRDRTNQPQYRDRRRHRCLQVERNYSSMSQLLGSVLQLEGQIRVVVMEFAYAQPSSDVIADFDFLVSALIRDRGRLLDICRNSESIDSAVAAYVWHLSYDFEVGPFIRVYFMVREKGLGVYQKFIARVGRAWTDLTQGVGVWRSDVAHPNPLVAAAQGLVAKDALKRIKIVQRALWYEVQKEEWMRIWLPERHRAFGMSEVRTAVIPRGPWDVGSGMLEQGFLRSLRMPGSPV